jgi:hypothetical protein
MNQYVVLPLVNPTYGDLSPLPVCCNKINVVFVEPYLQIYGDFEQNKRCIIAGDVLVMTIMSEQLTKISFLYTRWWLGWCWKWSWGRAIVSWFILCVLYRVQDVLYSSKMLRNSTIIQLNLYQQSTNYWRFITCWWYWLHGRHIDKHKKQKLIVSTNVNQKVNRKAKYQL